MSSSGFEAPDDVLMLDIYAEKTANIERCKRDLEKELERAMTTVNWSDKLTYEDDKELIAALKSHEVKILFI